MDTSSTDKGMFSDESGSFFSNLMGMLSSSSSTPAKPAAGDNATAIDTPGAPAVTPPPENMEQLPGISPYIAFCRGDKEKAWALYSHGQAIRKELGLDTILQVRRFAGLRLREMLGMGFRREVFSPFNSLLILSLRFPRTTNRSRTPTGKR
jgi:hypothetical protein